MEDHTDAIASAVDSKYVEKNITKTEQSAFKSDAKLRLDAKSSRDVASRPFKSIGKSRDDKREVKTGSIIFFDGKDTISNIIKAGTLGRWSHVGIAVVMSHAFKKNFVDFIGHFKAANDSLNIDQTKSHLPLFDRFGMVNNISLYSGILKQDYSRERKKQKSTNCTVFNANYATAKGFCFLPKVDIFDATAMAEKYWLPSDCVRYVVVELNNIVHACVNPSTRKSTKPIANVAYLEYDETFGSRILPYKSDFQNFNAGVNNKLRIGNDDLIESLLTFLKLDETFDIEQKVNKTDASNDFMMHYDRDITQKITDHPSYALLTHIVQLIEAVHMVEMTNISDAISKDVKPSAIASKTAYLWESTTDKMPDCYDELTHSAKESVKMTMLRHRLTGESYHAFAKREFETKTANSSESSGISFKSLSNSAFEPYDAMIASTAPDGEKFDTPTPSSMSSRDFDDDDVVVEGDRDGRATKSSATTSPRTKRGDAMLSRSQSSGRNYAYLFRSVSTVSKIEKRETTKKITYGRTIIFRQRDKKNDRDENTTVVYEQNVYKAIICNMLINHGKSYQTTVSDFALAYIREMCVDLACCFCCCPSESKNTDGPSKYENLKSTRYNFETDVDDEEDDAYVGNLHDDEENKDFFCSELVYQTIMDVKLISEYKSLIANIAYYIDPVGADKSKIIYTLTPCDFETPKDYYAYIVALGLLLMFKSGIHSEFFDHIHHFNGNTNRATFAKHVEKITSESHHRKREGTHAIVPTKSPIVMSSCCVTPVDLFTLDVSGCLGVSLKYSDGAFDFNQPNGV
jgi:hypothetical protein